MQLCDFYEQKIMMLSTYVCMNYLFTFTYVGIIIFVNELIYPGETATLTCRMNSLNVTFQWVRTDGENVTFFDEDTDVETLDSDSNSTISTFNVTNVNYTDNNVGYYCNASGSNASTIVYLTGNKLKMLYTL